MLTTSMLPEYIHTRIYAPGEARGKPVDRPERPEGGPLAHPFDFERTCDKDGCSLEGRAQDIKRLP